MASGACACDVCVLCAVCCVLCQDVCVHVGGRKSKYSISNTATEVLEFRDALAKTLCVLRLHVLR
jgi:hypothetical protein